MQVPKNHINQGPLALYLQTAQNVVYCLQYGGKPDAIWFNGLKVNKNFNVGT